MNWMTLGGIAALMAGSFAQVSFAQDVQTLSADENQILLEKKPHNEAGPKWACGGVLIQKSAQQLSVGVGEELTFKIRIANFGNCILNNVKVADIISPGVVIKNFTCNDTVSSGNIGTNPKIKEHQIDLFPNGEEVLCTLRVKPLHPANRFLVNQACVAHPWIETVCDTAVVFVEKRKTGGGSTIE